MYVYWWLVSDIHDDFILLDGDNHDDDRIGGVVRGGDDGSGDRSID